MPCYDGLGNIAARRVFTGQFSRAGRDDVLFYYRGDGNWFLGSHDGTSIVWQLVGNTMSGDSNFGQLDDGRPIWIGDFNGNGLDDVLFYFPADGNWFLGSHDGGRLVWRLVGNTMSGDSNFGQIADGRPIWIGDFNEDGKDEVLFYFPADGNWFLGSHEGTRLVWQHLGNTLASLGQLADGRPIWTGTFARTTRDDVMFYFPGDGNWFVGSRTQGQLSWQHVGNTMQGDTNFGQIADGRPIWIGDFTGGGRDDVLFYFPGDGNWFLGTLEGNRLVWQLVGNTMSGASNFGQIADGRPIWIGDFIGGGRDDVLFYFPGDGNWFLGTLEGNRLVWRLVGNTMSGASNFGQLADGRPIWIGDFNGDGRDDVLFYFPGDGNWFLGSHDGTALRWRHVGNTGRPFDAMIRLHIKVLMESAVPSATMFAQMRQLYEANNILVQLASTETLNLPDLLDMDVGECVSAIGPFFGTTDDQDALFEHRNNVGEEDMVAYFVRSAIGADGALNGCATHPGGKRGAVVARIGSQWTLAHEIGHVLSLGHVDDNTRLMTGNGTDLITGIPLLVEDEVDDIVDEAITCD